MFRCFSLWPRLDGGSPVCCQLLLSRRTGNDPQVTFQEGSTELWPLLPPVGKQQELHGGTASPKTKSVFTFAKKKKKVEVLSYKSVLCLKIHSIKRKVRTMQNGPSSSKQWFIWMQKKKTWKLDLSRLSLGLKDVHFKLFQYCTYYVPVLLMNHSNICWNIPKVHRHQAWNKTPSSSFRKEKRRRLGETWLSQEECFCYFNLMSESLQWGE